ncbi:MAG: ADP-ribosylation factor-like protein [Candidatus Helarchaeales archaeon]
MPIGISLIGWTNKEGFFLIKSFPDFEISDEEVMQIGSLHRMRNLKPNFITLNTKNYKIASFFTGMATHRYYIVPNLVISLFLKKEETGDYSKILPLASRQILEKIRPFDYSAYQDRTLSMADVLDRMGSDYVDVLPKTFMDLSLGNVQISEEELSKIFQDEEESVQELSAEEIQEKLSEKERGMALYEKLVENLKEKIKNQEEDLQKSVSETEKLKKRIESINEELKTVRDNLAEEMEAKRELKSKIENILLEFKEKLLTKFPKISKHLDEFEGTFQELKDEINNLFKEKETRMLFLGNNGVGKKSLLGLLLNQNTDSLMTGEATHEVQISSKHRLLISLQDFENVNVEEILEMKPDAIVFVTDSKLKDVMQVLQVYDAIKPYIEDVKVGIIANKQDQPGASSPEAISKFFQVPILGFSAMENIESSRLLNFLLKLS